MQRWTVESQTPWLSAQAGAPATLLSTIPSQLLSRLSQISATSRALYDRAFDTALVAQTHQRARRRALALADGAHVTLGPKVLVDHAVAVVVQLIALTGLVGRLIIRAEGRIRRIGASLPTGAAPARLGGAVAYPLLAVATRRGDIAVGEVGVPIAVVVGPVAAELDALELDAVVGRGARLEHSAYACLVAVGTHTPTVSAHAGAAVTLLSI